MRDLARFTRVHLFAWVLVVLGPVAASAQVSEQAVSGAVDEFELLPRPGSGAILGTATAAPVRSFGFAAGLSAQYS